MEKQKITMTYNEIMGVNVALDSVAQSGESIGDTGTMVTLAIIQSDLRPFIDAIEKARKPSDDYVRFVTAARVDGADIAALEDEYAEAIELAKKQNEELAQLGEQEVTIQTFTVDAEDLNVQNYMTIRQLLPIIRK